MTKTGAHEFGRYIRSKRLDADVSLREAAKNVGVSAVYLGEVERGVRPPLKVDHWDRLMCAIPGVELDSLEKTTVKSKPLQLDLMSSPPQYQDLGMALARRIEKQNISQNDLQKLFSILGEDNE